MKDDFLIFLPRWQAYQIYSILRFLIEKKTVIISSNAILEVVFGDGHPLILVFDKARPDCTKILNCQIEKRPYFFLDIDVGTEYRSQSS